MKLLSRIGLTIGIFIGLYTASAQAQTEGAAKELARLQGHWRITAMTESGRTITEPEMRRGLPGGGLVEIIDQTLLFKSPVDGHKSTKSFRIDAASYPKNIAIVENERVTGVGIYEFDRGRWVICVTSPGNDVPTEFTASEGSGRVLMVLESFDPGRTDLQLDLTPRPRTPQIVPVAQASVQKIPELQKIAPKPPAQPPIIIQQVPAPQIIIEQKQEKAAGRVLSDDEVRTMVVGNWQMKDSEGLVEVTFYANGTFRTYRRSQQMTNFHTTFVPTPVSTGTWSVEKGVLNMQVTSSWRADKVNVTTSMAVRSISNQDAILVDSLGRVGRAIKMQ